MSVVGFWKWWVGRVGEIARVWRDCLREDVSTLENWRCTIVGDRVTEALLVTQSVVPSRHLLSDPSDAPSRCDLTITSRGSSSTR